jgi:hypothetical protein
VVAGHANHAQRQAILEERQESSQPKDNAPGKGDKA